MCPGTGLAIIRSACVKTLQHLRHRERQHCCAHLLFLRVLGRTQQGRTVPDAQRARHARRARRLSAGGRCAACGGAGSCSGAGGGSTGALASNAGAEGGWPKDVDPTEPADVQRYRKKAEKDDDYKANMKALGPIISRCMRQNNTIDIYEEYFAGDASDHSGEPPSAKGSTSSPAITTSGMPTPITPISFVTARRSN